MLTVLGTRIICPHCVDIFVTRCFKLAFDFILLATALERFVIMHYYTGNTPPFIRGNRLDLDPSEVHLQGECYLTSFAVDLPLTVRLVGVTTE